MKIPSLVSVQWLTQALAKTKSSRHLRIVDATWRLEDGSITARQDHLENRIPGSVFFDIDECCDKSNKMDHMLPDEKLFAEYVRHLGINNDSHVIAYDNNEDFGLFSSPRVWWTFRYFGHNAISVLNGGLSKWLDAGLPVDSETSGPPKTDQPFLTKLHKDLLRDYETMVANVKSGGKMYPVVDARGRARFRGTQRELRPGKASGHIPYSANVPFVECLDENGEMMKDPELLKKMFAENGVDLSRPFTATCGSGITASVLAFAAHQCDVRDVSVYDGSWSEWGQRAPPEMVEKD